MGEKRVEPQDFLKNLREYLSQQTRQVNELAWDLAEQAHDPGDGDALDGSPPVLMLDDSGRTLDGKLQCPYCGYASERAERLLEHIRIHTGEKPHRCHLCSFASAYERYLEAHMRSHTGEKPYKCELCPYRCNYRSNLSHHQRRRHNLLPLTGPRASLSSVKMWGALQNKSNAGGKQRMLIALGPPSGVVQKPGYLSDFPHKIPDTQNDFYDSMDKPSLCGLPRNPEELLLMDNPLNQMSALAGHFSSLPPENQNLISADVDSSLEENPFVIQQPSAQGSVPQSSPMVLEPHPPSFSHRDCSPFAGPSSQPSGQTTSTSILGNSQPNTPALTLPAEDPQLLYHCQHCDTYFADNVLYTIHMGCHGYDSPFRCNVCGYNCKNKYDFACHFARGQHN